MNYELYQEYFPKSIWNTHVFNESIIYDIYLFFVILVTHGTDFRKRT